MDRSKIIQIVKASYPETQCKDNYRCISNGCDIVKLHTTTDTETLIKCNYENANYCINSFAYGDSFFCLCKPHHLILDLK